MFKSRQVVSATDGGAVQEHCEKKFCLITFNVARQVFDINDSINAREIDTILVNKGDKIP